MDQRIVIQRLGDTAVCVAGHGLGRLRQDGRARIASGDTQAGGGEHGQVIVAVTNRHGLSQRNVEMVGQQVEGTLFGDAGVADLQVGIFGPAGVDVPLWMGGNDRREFVDDGGGGHGKHLVDGQTSGQPLGQRLDQRPGTGDGCFLVVPLVMLVGDPGQTE